MVPKFMRRSPRTQKTVGAKFSQPMRALVRGDIDTDGFGALEKHLVQIVIRVEYLDLMQFHFGRDTNIVRNIQPAKMLQEIDKTFACKREVIHRRIFVAHRSVAPDQVYQGAFAKIKLGSSARKWRPIPRFEPQNISIEADPPIHVVGHQINVIQCRCDVHQVLLFLIVAA